MVKILWVTFVVLLYHAVQIDCSEDEFVTIFTPKRAHAKKDFTIVVAPSNLDLEQRTEMTVRFRRQNGTALIGGEKMIKFGMPNNAISGAKRSFNMTMILSRNLTDKAHPQCISKTIDHIVSEKRKFHIFIQTDKPIYKPGNDVRYRLLVLNPDLKPYHANNIVVNFTDPFGNLINTFDKIEGSQNVIGVINNTFTLSESTILGNWTISAVVEKERTWMATKTFEVKRYVLPEFAVHIKAKEEHILFNTDLTLSFYAEYSFGAIVKGNATVTVSNPATGVVLDTKHYVNKEEVQTYAFSATASNGISIKEDKLELEAMVEFTDSESDVSESKTLRFFVHADSRRQLDLEFPEKFVPGTTFSIIAFASLWNNQTKADEFETVDIKYRYKFGEALEGWTYDDAKVENGIVFYRFIVPINVTEMELKVFYVDCKRHKTFTYENTQYEELVKSNDVEIRAKGLVVRNVPKSPLPGSEVTIHIRSFERMYDILLIFTTRFGNIKNEQVQCKGELLCEYSTTVHNNMLPKVTVLAYQISGKNLINQGRTSITFEKLGSNHLNLSFAESAKTGENVKMTFESMPGSHVFLLAYDKRLTYLRDGNEVTRKDVIENVANFDGYNSITVIDINKNDWKDCTEEELETIEKGRSLTSLQSDTYFNIESCDSDFDEEGDSVPDEPFGEPTDDDSDGTIRKNFDEVWLFDDFVMDANTTSRSFLTTDSITSWKISAFAMSRQYGLAMADTKELTVENDFFMKVLLPYSIRYQEILRVDILVFNYIESAPSVNVTVAMFNRNQDFQFVDENENVIVGNVTECISIQWGKLKRVSFYIQPLSSKRKFSKQVEIYATAKTSTGRKDTVIKKLKVEPIGFKIYEIEDKSDRIDAVLKPGVEHLKIEKGQKRKNLEQTKLDLQSRIRKFIVMVQGDVLSDEIKMNEYTLDGTLEDKTSRLKANVEYYRYKKAKDPNTVVVSQSYVYQEILTNWKEIGNYKVERVEIKEKWCWIFFIGWETKTWTEVKRRDYVDKTGWKANLAEILASAMDIGALPKGPRNLQQLFNEIAAQQAYDGYFFNFGTSHSKYFRTIVEQRMFETAYVLIPFLKFHHFFGQDYRHTIDRGMKYLKQDISSISHTFDREVLSLCAVAFALNNDTLKAKTLLNQVEEQHIIVASKKKCLVNIWSPHSCDLRHTAFAAIAYLTLNERSMTIKAIPLVNYLLESNNIFSGYSSYYGPVMEAIAKLAAKNVYPKSDIIVKIENESTFRKTLHIKNDDIGSGKLQEIAVPEFSEKAKVTASGIGYCSVAIVVEKTIEVDTISNAFNVTTSVSDYGGRKNEKIVEVCATYINTTSSVDNVIYDIEFPSGYKFVDILDKGNIVNELENIEPKNGNTRVVLYYRDFLMRHVYCASVRAIQVAEVKKRKSAGLKVFNKNEKDDYAISFYNFK